jgi:hypothetical protein
VKGRHTHTEPVFLKHQALLGAALLQLQHLVGLGAGGTEK